MIYTKTGDNGSTALGNGQRVSKAHPRVEAYGTLDELDAHIGLLRSHSIAEPHKAVLLDMQKMLMRCAAALSCCQGFAASEEDVLAVEREINALQKLLPAQRHFIVTGGCMAAAQSHVARCVCRRAERCVVALGDADPILLKLLNRISDYLFVLARTICAENGVEELAWKGE
jgi:cob(I)alamin adenosyltransferase